MSAVDALRANVRYFQENQPIFGELPPPQVPLAGDLLLDAMTAARRNKVYIGIEGHERVSKGPTIDALSGHAP